MMSIYEQIDDAVRLNGYLPDDFSLNDHLKPSQVEPAHMGDEEGLMKRGDEETEKEMVKKAVALIKENINVNPRLAVHSFDDEEVGFTVARIRGRLLKNIIDNIKEYDPHKLSTLAYSLAIFGTKTETVKLGLLLLVMFDFADDEIVRKQLIKMGLYEDFTGYVIPNVKAWSHEISSHVFYVYAQKLKGWGKINAVENLEPVNDEVKEWLLKNGCRNEISNGYLAKCVYDKCDFMSRIEEGGFDEEQMQGARDIMTGLMEEGVAAGISAIERPDRLAAAYTRELKGHVIGLDDLSCMLELKRFLQEKYPDGSSADAKVAVETIDSLISNSDLEKMVKKGLDESPSVAIWAAEEGNIDITGELTECVRYDFLKYYRYAPYFLEKGRNVDEFLEICENSLDGHDFKEGMGNDLADHDSDKTWQLDIVMQYLTGYPGKGIKLINTALNSSILRYRGVAANVISKWEESTGKNIKKTETELFHTIKKLKKKEVNEDLKKKWDEILNFK